MCQPQKIVNIFCTILPHRRSATPPVAEAAVSSTASSNAANSVGGYTEGTLGVMMHDCVKWVFTGQQALKLAQEWQTVLELAQSKRQDAHDAPSCSRLKYITTEASQGSMDRQRNRACMGKLLRIARVQADGNVQGMWI